VLLEGALDMVYFCCAQASLVTKTAFAATSVRTNAVKRIALMASSCVVWLIFNGGCQTSALKPVFAVQHSLDRLLAWGARTPNDMPQRRTETKQAKHGGSSLHLWA
jgi:hypothetical protein